jgi:protein TonB
MNRKSQKYRFLPILALGLVVGSLGVGAFSLVRGFLHNAPAKPKQVVQQIKLIRPPPPPDVPPPPPPPPEEKIDVPDPQQRPDPTPSNDPPPGEQLALDAEGGAGGDAFGLLARQGGRDLIGGAGGSVYAWYGGLLKNAILDQLGAEQKARSTAYSVVVRVWVRNDGTIERVRIAQSSGNPERDQSIETALSRITRLSQAPPADMPEPITLRIVSRS